MHGTHGKDGTESFLVFHPVVDVNASVLELPTLDQFEIDLLVHFVKQRNT